MRLDIGQVLQNPQPWQAFTDMDLLSGHPSPPPVDRPGRQAPHALCATCPGPAVDAPPLQTPPFGPSPSTSCWLWDTRSFRSRALLARLTVISASAGSDHTGMRLLLDGCAAAPEVVGAAGACAGRQLGVCMQKHVCLCANMFKCEHAHRCVSSHACICKYVHVC